MPVYVPLERVQDNPYQTRSRYDAEAVAALADAIERDGMLQTPAGRLTGNGGNALGQNAHTQALYRGDAFTHAADRLAENAWLVQLAFGHTRARAWRLIWERRAGDLVAGAEGIHGVPPGTMPVELRPMTDDQMERLAWTENHDRNDLDPVDRAAAIAARVERHGWTHAEAGEALGMERSTVSNILRWFEALTSGRRGWRRVARRHARRDDLGGHGPRAGRPVPHRGRAPRDLHAADLDGERWSCPVRHAPVARRWASIPEVTARDVRATLDRSSSVEAEVGAGEARARAGDVRGCRHPAADGRRVPRGRGRPPRGR